LTADQASYYRGLKYLALKQEKGGFKNVERKGKKEERTSEILASRFDISESTVKRDAKFAAGLDVIGRSNPDLKQDILMGRVAVKKADIQTIGMAPDSDRITIRNAADLYNKAKNIREDAMEEVERKIKELNREKVRESP
jgi:hypothetical protein